MLAILSALMLSGCNESVADGADSALATATVAAVASPSPQINPLVGAAQATSTAVPAPVATSTVVATVAAVATPTAVTAAPSPTAVVVVPTAPAVVEPTATPVPVVAVAPTATAIVIAPTATTVPVAAAPVGARTWYTSSHHSADYYYCDLDQGWKGLSPTYLKSYPSEAALLAEWAGQRVKHPESVC